MGNGVLTAVVILAVIVCAAFAGLAVLRKLRNSPELEVIRYAAKAVRNGDINDRISTTPKSLSNMEKIFLPQILKDFPEFNWNEFKPRIQADICRMLRAIDTRDTGPVAENPELRAAVEQVLAGTRIPHYKDVKVHDTVIKRYYKQEGTCCILCESSVEYYTYAEENNKVVSGYKDRKRQEVYETELVYVQDAGRTSATGVGVTCPNCGAPITSLGAKWCEYCGTAVEPLNLRVWKISAIRLA